MTERGWRAFARTFVEIGRALSQIEESIRTVQATAVASEYEAKVAIEAAASAARRLVRELDSLRYGIRKEEE